MLVFNDTYLELGMEDIWGNREINDVELCNVPHSDFRNINSRE